MPENSPNPLKPTDKKPPMLILMDKLVKEAKERQSARTQPKEEK